MPAKPITRDRWLKGLQAGFDRMSQPKGSISRVSNLVYTRRGGLKTCDGSQVFSAFGGVQPLQWDPLGSKMWRELVYYAPSSGLRTGYYGLYSDPSTKIQMVTGAIGLTGVSSVHGLTGSFMVQVHAVDGVGGETVSIGEGGPISLSGQALQITWPAVPGAYGYNIYLGPPPSGSETLWLPPGSVASAAGVSVLARDANGQPIASPSATVDSTWVNNAGQQPPPYDTTGSLIFTQIPPGGYSGSNVIHVFAPAVSVISTGPSAASATTTDVQALPVVTTVPLRPTTSVQGGPSGGTPNDFANPQFAQDGLPTTAAVANVPPGGSNGAQRTWSGFPASPSGTTGLVLNVTSSWQLSNPSIQQAIVLLMYSLDAGASWRTLFHGAGSYATSTQSLALPTSQDLSRLRVNVTAAVATLAASGVMSVWDIWVQATFTPGPPPPTPPPTSISTAATPNGGLEGVCGPLPQIVTFRGQMILALGNGVPPYLSDGSAAGTMPITNTFTAVYPDWAPSTNYNVGDQIRGLSTSSGAYYVFTATQGGTTGSSQPAWPPTIGQTVTDNNIIWKNSGQVSNSPSPPGTAHAEIYAGSLWVANTWPTMTADQLDGPSALRMSILNDPNGWNPLNAAQIAPDDSDECQGIKAFTIAEAGIAPENFLVFFKNFSTYLVQGVFGASNFAITRLQTDLGCVASRTIQFVPGFGIMRFSHLGFAVTDGINDKLQDPEAIRPYIFAESTESDIPALDWSEVWFSKSAQTIDPPMYVAAMPLVGANAQLIGVLQGVVVNVAGSGGGGPGPTPGGSFSFSPPTIALGNVPQNVLARTLIEITFAGTGPVTLNSVTLDNPVFQLSQMPALPYTFNNNGDFTGWYVGINTVVGSYSATMSVETSVATYTIPVTANVVAGNIGVTPPQLAFPNTVEGATSAAQTISITNNEPGPVDLGGYSITSGPATPSLNFALAPVPPFPQTIAPGQTLAFNVVATPQSTGSLTATLTILTNLVGVSVSVSLSVTGVALTVSPTVFDFPSTSLNTPTAPVTISVSNNAATGIATLTSASFPNPVFSFAVQPTFPMTIGPGQTQTFSVVATPNAAGTVTGTLVFQTTLSGVTLTVNFSATGTGTGAGGGLVVNPSYVGFPPTLIGSQAGPTGLAITNNGSAPATLQSYSFSNAVFSFDVTPSFPIVMAAGQTVTFGIDAVPAVTGVNHGNLVMPTSIAGVTLSISLTVTGTASRTVPPDGGTSGFLNHLGERLRVMFQPGRQPPAPMAPVTPRASADPGLPAGNYFVQVGLRGPNGVTSLSPVLGPFTVNAANDLLQVTSPSLSGLPLGYYGYRIWFGTDPAVLDQFVDGNTQTITISGPGQGGAPPQSIPGSLTRLFCYDLVLKAWTVVDLPFSISAMKQFRVMNNQPWTALGGSYDSAIRRWQSGDPDWDPGALATQPDVRVRWNFLDAEVHTQGATVRLFHNQQIIRGSGGPASISVTPQVNGYLQQTIKAAMIALGSGQFEARSRILQAFENVAYRVSGVGPAVVESVDYNVQPKPVGGAIVYS